MKKFFVYFLIISFITSFGCKKNKKQNDQISDQDTITYEETALPFEQEFSPFDSAQGAPENPDQVLAVDTTTNQITPVSDEVVEKNPGDIYIIVGSFQKYENAVKAQKYYEHLGYSPKILPQVAGFNRVAIQSFTDLGQARQQLRQLRKKFNRPDFWLLYKK